MGSGCSQNDPGYNHYAAGMYRTASHTCVMPDVDIDYTLLIYSGVNANTHLQSYSNQLLNSAPGAVQKLGAGFGKMTKIPNAVGFGALVISMIMELTIKGSTQTQSQSPYKMLQRVFGEEKAFGVRDTMSESVTRYQTFINDNQRLLVEMTRLEAQLSNHLTVLKNSLLHDNQMSSRGFKMWVNGAACHLQMRIHEARLNIQNGRDASKYTESVQITISLYLQDLERLLEKYKTYKISTTQLEKGRSCFCSANCYCNPRNCYITDTEKKNCQILYEYYEPCSHCMTEAFINHVFSNYYSITSLRNHFSDISNNLNVLIHEQGVFTLPTIT